MEVESELAKRKNKSEPKGQSKIDNAIEDEPINRNDQQQPEPDVMSSIYNYLVVLSIILIIFAAFRNSLTW
jgi:hypothetical protein